MENKETTRTCGQCNKEVAEINFALHETHCRRFLCVCPDCDEAVPREQLNQHKEDEHAVVRCSKCNTKMERRHLMDHEADECVERLQACQFCNLELPWKQLDEHCLSCGSRTELCKDCGRYVKLREQSEHSLTCSNTDSNSNPPQTASSPPNMTKPMVQCRRCTVPFPVADITEHEFECYVASRCENEEALADQAEDDEDEGDFSSQVTTPQQISTYEATFLSDRLYRSPWAYYGGDPYQIMACPHCHLALPVKTLRWHQGKCQRYILLK
ncbi:hypothetical protein Q5P01_009848 [Channa striata]|uniref:TRAF-type domain-containing protein n=1 Tax=Channa striata TaxID=64152 RepID=A0AA88SR77_CHASR|nr:hypothetical protein Q5P01_009848 [Channa striata]